MDINEFREFGHAAIEFLVEYLETIRDRLVKFRNILGNLNLRSLLIGLNKICFRLVDF